jgi:hypothetical protein
MWLNLLRPSPPRDQSTEIRHKSIKKWLVTELNRKILNLTHARLQMKHPAKK